MGYELRAVITDPGLLMPETAEVSAARVVPLSQGLAFGADDDESFAAFTDGTRSDGDDLGFQFLPGGFARALAAWSADGPVAYVEAEYFGGRRWAAAAARSPRWVRSATGIRTTGPRPTASAGTGQSHSRYRRGCTPTSRGSERTGDPILR